MKKIILLLTASISTSLLVHAETQSTPTKTIEQPSPTYPDTGSGDDIDTISDADPVNDKDPEADDSSPTK